MDQETDFETITKTGMSRNVDMQAMAGGIMTGTGTTMRRTLGRVPRDGEMKVDGDTEEGGAETEASEVEEVAGLRNTVREILLNGGDEVEGEECSLG